jgi:hypothetical protein
MALVEVCFFYAPLISTDILDPVNGGIFKSLFSIGAELLIPESSFMGT